MKNWNMREIVIMVVLSIVCGIVYMPWGNVWLGLNGVFGPAGGEAVYGLWFVASVLVAYIVRKPGAAFTAEMVAALAELMLGSQFGPQMLISAAIQGALSELAFALFGYRKYTVPVLLLAGIFPAAGSFVYEFAKASLETMSTGMLIAAFCIRLVSGAILAGLLGKAVADLLARTGVLNGYAIIRDTRNNSNAF
ncbi:ECF transporter S component [Effusibacillus lacus]|uniref:Thiamine permease n=1 Tax=Effusibacillus lacus TaxID=1348429 RepID=A0A292YDG8_9BACL|nr:ECF transporter S component [Effusibacillus lacus]TCS71627.1 energy-coupling factor transport system substrate-specific component [Effusibacillus lacus]GAX90132.1 thiamine permease [Effusibacillus lacus]